MTTEHDTLAQALVAALSELMVVEADQHADAGTYGYDYANIQGVVKTTRPVLAEHGIVALTPLHSLGTGPACSVVLIHTSGERMDFGPFPFPQGRDAQATGSMVTYHRRYALVAALGMAAGKDDDGASALPREPEPPASERTVSATNAAAIRDKATAAGLEVAEVVRLGTNGRTQDPAEVLLSEVPAVREAMDNLTPAPGGGAP